MNKKNIATTCILLLCSVLFAVVGSTFMNLLYEKNKIVVEDPKVVVAEGILVYNSQDENKTQIQTIEFSDMNLGLKPVTGQLDKETNIPSTVTNKKGTEGLYAAIKITAQAGLKIQVTNIIISSEQDSEKIEAERKNMWIALKDIKDSAKTLEADVVNLTSLNQELKDQEFVILFWLGGNADKILKGAIISFEMHFIV